MPATEMRFDGRWRPEPHPFREGEWLLVRYYAEDGYAKREVHATVKEGRISSLSYSSEEEALGVADGLNPVPEPDPEHRLSQAARIWLQRLADAPEGRMERQDMRSLLSLEHQGLVTSRPEPGRPSYDRWTITEAGRKALAGEEETD